MKWNPNGAGSGAISGAAMGTAIAPGWGTLIGGAAGGLLGGLFTEDGSAQWAEQERLMEETLAELEGIPLPELRKLQFENPSWLQDLVAARQAESEMNNINVDPRLQNKQYAALNALDDIVQGGGMTAEDRANLSRIQDQAATADRGRREAILQNMNQRGMSGSGLELLNQLQSNQSATNLQAQQGLDVAGMAQKRALDAIMQQGNLAGNIRGQSFDEQSKIAAANDAINRFNAQNQMDANQFNITGRQGIANAGVDLRNQAMKYNTVDRQQNQFRNALDLAAAKGQARGQNIQMIGDKRAEDINTRANQMGAATQMGTAIASNWQSRNNNQQQQPQQQPVSAQAPNSNSSWNVIYQEPKNNGVIYDDDRRNRFDNVS